MFILSCGGWYVGNSAVIEWLSRYPQFYYLKGDFHELRSINGIYDCIAAPDRILKWKWILILIIHHIKGIFRSILESFRQKKRTTHGYILKYNITMLIILLGYFFHSIFNFRDKKQDIKFWRDKLIILSQRLGRNSSELILQNPIYYDNIAPEHIKIWREIFNIKKIIFVTRDPVDQFIDIYNHGELRYGQTRFRHGTKGLNEVETYFKICRRTYESRLKMLREYSVDELCIINFERFSQLSNVDEKALKKFFKINTRAISSFDFSYTESNTNLALRYPEIGDLLKPYEKELDELYVLKEMLDESAHSLTKK
jgi:hypothetical protein